MNRINTVFSITVVCCLRKGLQVAKVHSLSFKDAAKQGAVMAMAGVIKLLIYGPWAMERILY
jgi:hypothetical protein